MKRVSFDLEYIFRASPTILYQFITTPSCLIRWFCDGADVEKDVYTFEWRGFEETADMIDDIEDERIRFRWEDSEDNEYLEFRFSKSPVTNETVCEITGFCDKNEVDEQADYWNDAMTKLRSACGG